MKKIAIALMTLALLGGSALAQGGPGGPGKGNRDGSGPNADLLQAATVTGAVVSFAAETGAGKPTLVVRDAAGDHAFVLGPYRVITAQGFAAQAGDQVEVGGWTCTVCETAFVVAQVKNLTRSLTLVLRNTDGTPTWQGGGAPRQHRGHGGNGQPGQEGDPACTGTGQGAGQGRHGAGEHARQCGGEGPDMARVATIAGTVKSFTGGAGQGQPTLVVTDASGDRTVRLAPYRALRRADYVPQAGALVEVVAAPVTRDGVEEWVAVSLKDVATGLVIQLRDATTGLPVGGGCRR